MGLARAGCQRLSVIPTDWHQLALPVSHPSKSWSLTEPSARGQRVRRLEEEEEEGGGQVEMKEKGRWRGQGRILGSQPGGQSARPGSGCQFRWLAGLHRDRIGRLAVSRAGRSCQWQDCHIDTSGWHGRVGVSMAGSQWPTVSGSFDGSHHQQWQESRNLPATTLCTKFLLCQNPALALLSHRNCVQCVKFRKVRI